MQDTGSSIFAEIVVIATKREKGIGESPAKQGIIGNESCLYFFRIQIDITSASRHTMRSYDQVRMHKTFKACDEQDVASVTVDGKLLMRDGEFLTINTERVAKEATN